MWYTNTETHLLTNKKTKIMLIPTLETTQSINKISTALLNAKIPVSAIECKDYGFYVIWYHGSSTSRTRSIRKALKNIGASICIDEDGFSQKKGAFITVALY